MSANHAHESRAAKIVRRLAVPIVLFWVAIAAVTNATAPPNWKWSARNDLPR